MKEFECEAVKIKDGNIAVWTDGFMIQSDNERPCLLILEEGKRYKIKIEVREIDKWIEKRYQYIH